MQRVNKMNHLFSYLRWFQEKLKDLLINQKYKQCIILSLCTMIGMAIFFFTQSYCADDSQTVKVQAKATYDYLGRVEQDGSCDNSLGNEDQLPNGRIKEIYVSNELLNGASALPTEPVVEADNQGITKEYSSRTKEQAQEWKQLEQEIKSEQEGKKKYVVKLSSSERNILERIVQAEAGNQDTKGRMLVANVVLNRVKSDEFPDTVRGVVFQHKGRKYQFSPAKSGSVHRVKVTKVTKNAVERVLKGEDVSKGALFFVARSVANRNSLSWFDRELKKLYKHGGHTFYK